MPFGWPAETVCRRALLDRLRAERGDLEVHRPPATRAASADGSAWPAHRRPHAVGPTQCSRERASADIRGTVGRRAESTGDRRRRDNVAPDGRWSKEVAGVDAAAPDAVFCRIQDRRSTDTARQLLGQYRGTVVCDDYSAYKSLRKRGAELQLAHCWAHVRRKFIDAEGEAPKECAEAIAMIAELYAVEKRANTGPLKDERACETKNRDLSSSASNSGRSAFARCRVVACETRSSTWAAR